VLDQQHERYVEELYVQLSFRNPITASGAVMTLPASGTDLTDWIADQREFLQVQYDDWMQVIEDFRESLRNAGPKLKRLVDPITTPIESLLQNLMPYTVAPDGTRINTIDPAVRSDVLQHLEQLNAELATEAAILAAWRDLVSSCENVNRTVEEVSFRRDTLCAIAQNRALDLGTFGVFWHVSAVLTDDANAVQQELDRAAGVEPTVTPWTGQPSGQATWQRLQLCEQVLTRPAWRGDCIVWLRLAPTSLPQHEVTHGQVTFYNAAYLSGHVGHPELASNFNVAPTEILEHPRIPPFLRDGEVEWEDDWNMAYARVVLPDTEVHAAEAKARALVEAITAVNHATKDTWRLMNGSIIYVDGRRRDARRSWGRKDDIPDHYYPQNDWMGRDIERMSGSNQTLDSQSIHNLQDAIRMSTALKSAIDPETTVMAAVRAIEHVNAWTTGGRANWVDFVSDYFKKAQSRVRFVELISHFVRAALDNVPDRRPGVPEPPELFEVRARLRVFVWPHELFNVRGAADEISQLKRIYADHWLVRGLGELETALSTPAGMYARLEEQGRRFDRQLGRLKRLRNSAIHGGPLSHTACTSVGVFAFNLGHQCLNEAMTALLTGRDIPSYMTDYRDDHIARYQRAQTTGEIDSLFLHVHP
jgi:hypothetical protein